MTAAPASRLSETQHVILKAVIDLQPNAYSVTIAAQTKLSIGRVYSELDALENNYLIGAKVVPGGPERGGRPKRLFSITVAGRRAVADASPSQETES